MIGRVVAYDPWVYWWIVGVAAALIVLGLSLDRLALRAEARGWIYWRHSDRRGSGSLGYLEPIFQPSMTHVIEEETRERTEAEQDQSGEDP